jgi:hypothetical protein
VGRHATGLRPGGGGAAGAGLRFWQAWTMAARAP